MLLRRTVLAAAAIVTIATGLLNHYRGTGELSGLLGDALYAVMIYLLVACVLPAARRRNVLAGALAFCTTIEVLQATGIPRALVEQFAPLHLVFGTTFAWLDLVAYAVGAFAVAVLDTVLTRSHAHATAPPLPATRSGHTP